MCTVPVWASVKVAINNIYSVLKRLFLLEASINTLHKRTSLKQWHVQTQTWAHTHTVWTHICTFTFTCSMCSHISLSVLTNLDTPFFLFLHSSDNEAGTIPDTPSTMLDIVLSTIIESSREHEDHRPKHWKHKWDQSLWMTCTQSLCSLRIRALALFPCHGVLRLKS